MKAMVCQQLLETAKVELKKFLQLFVGNPRRMGMIAVFDGAQPCLVDEVWHHQVDNSEEYTEFCHSELGEFVTHLSVECGRETLAWVLDYERVHGHPLPDVWFCNSEGILDTEAYDSYLQGFHPQTPEKETLPDIQNAWKCTPSTEGRPLPEIKNAWKCTPSKVEGDFIQLAAVA